MSTKTELYKDIIRATGGDENTPDNLETTLLKRIAESVGGGSGGGSTSEYFETVGGDTLTWDGNTDGLYSVMDAYYHISDAVPTEEELQQGGSITLSNGNAVTFDNSNIQTQGDIIMAVVEDVGFAVISKDGVVLEPSPDLVITFEKAGVYLTAVNGIYMSSVTINGYTGFTTTKLKPEYLPYTDAESEVF